MSNTQIYANPARTEDLDREERKYYEQVTSEMRRNVRLALEARQRVIVRNMTAKEKSYCEGITKEMHSEASLILENRKKCS